MVQAKITINAVIGSDDDLPINTLVQLGNQNTGGELTYAWQILAQPVGPVDALSSTVIQNPTFTPRKEGTYLIKLTVNQSLATEKSDQVIAAVRQLKTRTRVPAAGETSENGAAGWASPAAANYSLQLLDTMRADPGLEVCVVDDPAVAIGTVVRYGSIVTIKSGLPGQEDLLGVYQASASTPISEPLGYVVQTVDGNPLAVGSLVVVRRFGLQASPAIVGAVIGQPVYLDNAGALSATSGATVRQVGVFVDAGLTTAIYFDGAQSSGGAAGGVGVKYALESTDNITVPNRYQYLVKAPLIIDPGGALIAAPGGQVVVLP